MAKTLFELWTPKQKTAWYRASSSVKKLLSPYILKASRGEIPISEFNKMAWKYGAADLMVKEETPKPKPVSTSKIITSTTPTISKSTTSKKVYTVKRGDSLSTIAAKYGMDWKTLHKANPQIKNPSLIYPGQKLVIPTTKTKKTTPDLDPNKVYLALNLKNGVVDKVYGTKEIEGQIREGKIRLATRAEYEKAKDFHSMAYSLWKSETGGKGSFPDWIQKNWRHYVLGEPKPKPTTTKQERIKQISETLKEAGKSAKDISRKLSTLKEAEEKGLKITPKTTSEEAEEYLESLKDTGTTTITLPPEFQELLDTLKDYLIELQKRGKIPAPKDLTPDEIAKFLTQAEKEISPYYATQLKLAKEGFLRSLGYTQETIDRLTEEAQREYQQNLRALGETMAERGFAESGIRKRSERELAWDTQRQLEEARRRALFETGTLARQFAQEWGEGGLPRTTEIPAVRNVRVLWGQPVFQEVGKTYLYELRPEVYKGLIGEKEWEKKAAIQQRKAELVGAEREKRQTQALRKLSL